MTYSPVWSYEAYTKYLILPPGSSTDHNLRKRPCEFLQLLFIFCLNLPDWLKALEVLLYNLSVLGSARRCMLHKHKSCIQNRYHSISSVGVEFSETLLMSHSIHGAFCFLFISVSTNVKLCWQQQVMKIAKVRLWLIFKFRSVIISNTCLVSVAVAYPTSKMSRCEKKQQILAYFGYFCVVDHAHEIKIESRLLRKIYRSVWIF